MKFKQAFSLQGPPGDIGIKGDTGPKGFRGQPVSRIIIHSKKKEVLEEFMKSLFIH